ncbi:MAG: tRNA pseudouridine(38-40) synthase TruA, partial [Chloroflexota bacterium]|nr:tRNA pseudouridine(38-40) synthase TruA [Chloroflexota bacterium]
EYRYSIWNAPIRSPLACRFACHYPRPLDVSLMNGACSHLVGARDFRSFGSAPVEGGSTVRTLYSAQCARDGHFIHVRLVANAFLRHMVRRIVGELLQVGSGELSPDDFGEILAAQDPGLIKVKAPAKGLCLIKVNYDAAAEGRPCSVGDDL